MSLRSIGNRRRMGCIDPCAFVCRQVLVFDGLQNKHVLKRAEVRKILRVVNSYGYRIEFDLPRKAAIDVLLEDFRGQRTSGGTRRHHAKSGLIEHPVHVLPSEEANVSNIQKTRL